MILVVWRSLHLLVAFERLQYFHDFVHSWSCRRGLLPASLDQIPELGGEPNVLSVLRELRSVPLQYLTRDFWVTPRLERGLSCKNLGTQHPKGEDVGRLGFYGCIAARWNNDLWGEPPRVPNSRRSYREA